MNEFTIGDIVRYYRLKNGMYQWQLAKKIGDYVGDNPQQGKAATTISRLENSTRRSMYPDRAFKMAKALHMGSEETMAFVLINSRREDRRTKLLQEEAWTYFIEKIGEKDLRTVRSPHRRTQAPYKAP